MSKPLKTPTKNLRPKKILNDEVLLDKNKVIVSKSDAKGVITYVNNEFIHASGYSRVELIGEPHSLLRHPDMPKIIFKHLWNALKKRENYHLITKNLRKDGAFYWIITDFSIDIDETTNKIKGYTGRRKYVPKKIIEKIEPFYKDLLDIEKLRGEQAGESYFESFLKEEVGKPYNEYIIDLFEKETQLKQKTERQKSIQRRLSWFFLTEYENE